MKAKVSLNSHALISSAANLGFLYHMATTNNSAQSVNTFAKQVSGFARWQIFALIAQTGLDFAQCWRGSQISDSYVTGLRELFGKVSAVKGGKAAVLIIQGRALFGYNVNVKGDLYTRREGAIDVTGSIALLERIYGKKHVTLGTAAQFDKLSASIKVDKDSELRGVAKAKKAAKAKKPAKSDDDGEDEGEE